MDLAPPRGMRDFYPEDFRAREALFSIWRETAALHGFEGYDAPVVETEELLIRKGGEEIVQQIYSFADKSDRRLALRPEMTPSLARMVVARQGSLSMPLKWWAIAQCFRYERMTRGRKREHFQWNLDVVGETAVSAEVEVIGAAVAAMRRMGLTADDFKVRVGSRALLAELFAKIGVGAEHFQAACLALDKRGKIDDDAIRALLAAEGLAPEASDRVFELLGIESLDRAEELLGADSAAIRRLRDLFALAGDAGFAEFLAFDVGVVRGLGYYTGIVFEAFDTAGKFRAIFGGGRYDDLLVSLGGKPCSCVGLGFGDVVVQELLTELGRPLGRVAGVDDVVGYMIEEARPFAHRVAARLRAEGRRVDLALAPEKPRKFFARADALGAARAIFLGPDEVASGRAKIKDLKTREESELDLERGM